MNQRPDPEELLHRVQIEEKKKHWGRLKIFLGYASRVGKSYRMFDEGRRRKERGQDVVVASVQSKVTPDLEQILKTLDVIPPLKVTTGQRTYEVLDIIAVLERRPHVCLVDELGYDNPPGSRNRTRWQDVRELLRNGITVVTAVNLQHIQEQQGSVESITGKRAAQTVPEAFIRTADEIVLVDAAFEDLENRDGLKSGVDSGRLFELRELALLLAADVVDKQLHHYLQSHGIEMFMGSQECILVCLTPRSNAKPMLESGRRNADRFHCKLLALHVRQKNLSPSDEAAVESNIELARELGAEVHLIGERDSVSAIVEFAQGHGVTQLFVGHTTPGGWRGIRARRALDRLIRYAKGMDVRVFPHVT